MSAMTAALPESASPESPPVAAAEDRAAAPLPVSGIDAEARSRLLTVSVTSPLVEVSAPSSGTQISVVVVQALGGEQEPRRCRGLEPRLQPGSTQRFDRGPHREGCSGIGPIRIHEHGTSPLQELRLHPVEADRGLLRSDHKTRLLKVQRMRTHSRAALSVCIGLEIAPRAVDGS